jgi:uncharacterized protein (TIGR00369 family)
MVATTTAIIMHVTTEHPLIQELHRSCFACGMANPDGLNLQFSITAGGTARTTWNPSDHYKGYLDRVHGGVLATLLDSAMVHGLFAQGVAAVTAELTVRYLRPVLVDAPVHVSGWVESDAHGLSICRSEIHQADTLAVTAKAKFITIRDAQPVQIQNKKE